MVEDDVSYISLHQVYEDFCNRSGVHKDKAIDFYVKSVEEAVAKRTDKDQKDWLNNVKMEIIQAIRRDIVPDTFLLDVLYPTENGMQADFGSSSRGRSRHSLISGFSGNNSPSNTRPSRSKLGSSPSTIAIHRSSSSPAQRGIFGIQRCFPRWAPSHRVSSTRIPSRSVIRRISRRLSEK
jgi:hypothetical protein